MNRWMCNAAMIASLVGTYAMSPCECAAGPLLDWLSGRTPYYRHQPWHVDRRYPRTSPQYPAVTDPNAPVGAYPAGAVYQQPTSLQTAPAAATAPALQQTPAFQTPTFQTPSVQAPAVQSAPISQPAAVFPQTTYVQRPAQNAGCAGCGLTRSWFTPRTAYRSTWVRVPVTRYRPIIGTTQIAYGVPATQPCNGYTWQLRRVPVTTFRPFAGLWSQLFGPRPPVSYFSNPAAAPCVTYGSTIAPAAPQGSPYYPAQSGTVPGTTTVVPSPGLGTVPNPVPSNAAPFNAAPFNRAPGNPPPSSGNTPADRAPSLSPTGLPNRAAMPQSAPSVLAPHNTARAPREVKTERSRVTSELTTSPPQTQHRYDNDFNVRPIRDPEAHLRHRSRDAKPQLLGPSNHSASYSGDDRLLAWQVVPIAWETAPRHMESRSSVQAGPQAAISSKTAPQSPPLRFDDSGWQSAR